MHKSEIMGGLRFGVLLVAVLFAVFSVDGYDVDSVLAKVPEAARKEFLTHHLNLGYELSKIDINRNNKIPQELKELPAEFSVALYEKFLKEHLVDDDKISPRENIICFPNGQCIDIDDPGVHPIPYP